MKGFAMLKIGEAEWIDKEIPVCGPLDAICRPLAVAVCSSDIHTLYEGGIGDRHNLILGHEAVGEIVEVGSLVRDFKVGDRVIVPAVTPDWGSIEAQAGFASHSGGVINGWKFANSKDGVFAEFFHVNHVDANVALLPDSINAVDGTMLTDMVSTGFRGVEAADVQFGDDVLVIGIGPVGLMAVAGANMRGAGRILAVGTRPVCVEAAKLYGATDFISYKNGLISQQVLEMTNGKGVDRVIIAGGGMETFSEAVKSLKPGGKIGSVNYLGKGDMIGIPRVEWGFGMADKDIIGTIMPGGRLRMEKLASLVAHGKLDLSPLSTHVYNGWSHMLEAVELMRDKPLDLIKPVVKLED